MAYSNISLNQVLTQCHYDQQTKNYLYQEQMHLMQTYQLSYKAVQARLPSGVFSILEASGTIPVIYNSQTYNIPIKIHYLSGYPNSPPILIVNPSPDMMIKSSEFVQEDGRTNLSIMRAWNSRCTTIQLLEEAKKAYSIKMPVFKRPKAASNISPNKTPNNGPDPRLFGQHQQGNPYGGLYSSVQPVQISANDPRYGSIPARPNEDRNFVNIPPVQPAPNSGIDPRYTSLPTRPNENRNFVNNPMPDQRGGYVPNNTLVTYTQNDIEKVKEVYRKTTADLKSEIKVLESESKQLENNSSVIAKSIENFKKELAAGQYKKDLIEASIKNTQDWISASSNSTMSDLSENDLIEYKNEYVKVYLDLSSQERALETTIQVVIDAINKSVVAPKESLLVLKQLYTDSFLTSRLKEKSLSISNNSN